MTKKREERITMKKEMQLEFDANSENEALARIVIAAFVTSLDPTLDEIQDIKTAVSEAVTNAIIHGYQKRDGKVCMKAMLEDNRLEIEITDKGIGIENVALAMQPLYTSKPEEERSGMGFSFMEAFMDNLDVTSKTGEGTTVHMEKYLNKTKMG